VGGQEHHALDARLGLHRVEATEGEGPTTKVIKTKVIDTNGQHQGDRPRRVRALPGQTQTTEQADAWSSP
jgi:hypothetical protein